MVGLYVFGLVCWLLLIIAHLAMEPVHRWLVKNRWAVDHDKFST